MTYDISLQHHVTGTRLEANDQPRYRDIDASIDDLVKPFFTAVVIAVPTFMIVGCGKFLAGYDGRTEIYTAVALKCILACLILASLATTPPPVRR